MTPKVLALDVDVEIVAGAEPNPLRSLFWGLLGFTILMLFVAWADIGEFFAPASTGPGVRLVDMPAPLLALNLALCALPLIALVLILAGVAGMLRWTPKLFLRLSWRVGRFWFTPLHVAAILVVCWATLFVAVVALALLQVAPAVVVAAGLAVSLLPVAIGWYLMVLSGWVLSGEATPRERLAMRVSVISAGVLAAFLIAARVAATFALGSHAQDPGVSIPPLVPWADAPAGVGGFGSLVVLTAVAKRASARKGKAPELETPSHTGPGQGVSMDRSDFVCSDCGSDVAEYDTRCTHCGALIQG